jgi:hypothetical protein
MKRPSKSDDIEKTQNNSNATRDDKTPRADYDRDQSSGYQSSIDENGVDSELVKLTSGDGQVISPTRSRLMSEDTGMESALSSRVPVTHLCLPNNCSHPLSVAVS